VTEQKKSLTIFGENRVTAFCHDELKLYYHCASQCTMQSAILIGYLCPSDRLRVRHIIFIDCLNHASIIKVFHRLIGQSFSFFEPKQR